MQSPVELGANILFSLLNVFVKCVYLFFLNPIITYAESKYLPRS